MRKVLFASFIVLVTAPKAFSQAHFKENNFFDVTTAVGKKQGSVSLSWSHIIKLGKKQKRFNAGYGLRFTSYFAKDQAYITAPARLTSRQTGPQVIFSKTYNESLDTIKFSKSQINSLNIALYFDYKITQRIAVGFNIDALGFSFGKRQNGRLISTLRPATLSTEQSAKPTSLNALLVSDNDIGSLNSEFVVGYQATSNISIKTGFCFLFAEYQSDQKLIFDNDRFRNKASMALIGISYNPFK
jgi:hypothetical protein